MQQALVYNCLSMELLSLYLERSKLNVRSFSGDADFLVPSEVEHSHGVRIDAARCLERKTQNV